MTKNPLNNPDIRPDVWWSITEERPVTGTVSKRSSEPSVSSSAALFTKAVDCKREQPMALGSFVYASLEQVLIHPHQSGHWELGGRNMHQRHALQKKITKRGKKVGLEADSQARNVNTGDSLRPASCALLP